MVNGKCPACQESVDKGATSINTSVKIDVNTKFPGICHQCGQETEETAYLEEWTRKYEVTEGRDQPIPVYYVLLFLLSPLLALLSYIQFASSKQEGYASSRSRIKIPTCKRCRVADTKILDCDHRAKTFRVVVNRRFAKELPS